MSKKEIIEKLEEMRAVQGNSLTNDYMIGMYNGIELCISIIKGVDPNYVRIEN